MNIIIRSLGLVMLFCFSVQLSFAQETKQHEEVLKGEQALESASFSVVSPTDFEKMYRDLAWIHIGRLQSMNPQIDLKSYTKESDWSRVKFKHDPLKRFAYRLYDGNFLVCKPIKK